MSAFNETGLSQEILDAVKDLGFEDPTPIQAKAIPHVLTSSQDLLAFAQTGTGKTGAFGLPVIQLTDVANKSPQTLILCPTRELCLQITGDLKDFSKYVKGLSVVAVYGGASIDQQIRALKNGAQIVIGTPGRVKDLIKRKRLNLSNVNRVVLDEADEMLSMGFKDDLDAILSKTMEDHQTLLFSATMSKVMEKITKEYLVDPVKLAAAKTNRAAENVKHFYYQVQARDKYELLKRLADMNPDIYGIVFCRTRRETREIANKLMHDGYNADAIHGDLSQAQRDEVMGRFRKKHLQILVATDVAARGLDVDDLTHVINYNLPDDDEVYVHRSGRTGRAGKSGISIAIIHTRERRKLNDIERKSGIKFRQQEAPGGKEVCQKQLFALIDKIKDVEVEESQIEPFLEDIYQKFEGLSREELIKHFVSAEFNRFLAYYKNARDLNVTKRDRKSPRERRRHAFTRLFVKVGQKNGLTPHRLIGVINEALDSGDAEIGKIEIMRNFTFFEVDENVSESLIQALDGKVFEGVELKPEISKDIHGGQSRKRDSYKGKGRSGGKKKFSGKKKSRKKFR
jgi:ATP-dependent RNA helicase DeaD